MFGLPLELITMLGSTVLGGVDVHMGAEHEDETGAEQNAHGTC